MRKGLAAALAALLVATLVPLEAFAEPSIVPSVVDDEGPEYTGTIGIAQCVEPIRSEEELYSQFETALPVPPASRGGDVALSAEGAAPSGVPAPCKTRELMEVHTDGLAGPSRQATRDALEPAEPASYDVGDTRDFYSPYRAGDPDFEIVCLKTGSNFTLWIDTEHQDAISSADIEELAREIPVLVDEEVALLGDWRGEGGYDVDGDGKVAFVFHPFSEGFFAEGFFVPADLGIYAGDHEEAKNRMDVLHINTLNGIDASGNLSLYTNDAAMSTLVHELAHFLVMPPLQNTESWINEMIAEGMMAALGYGSDGDALGLAYYINNWGVAPPFIFEGFSPTSGSVEELQAMYSAWHLFAGYLQTQTEGLPGGGAQIFGAMLDAAEDDGGSLTNKSITTALDRIGYLGEGENCKVKDFGELVGNFGRAYILREASGIYSLTGNPSAPSNLLGTEVAIAMSLPPSNTVFAGGSFAVVDLPEGSFTVDESESVSIEYAAVDHPYPVNEFIEYAPPGGTVVEGDLITLSFASENVALGYRLLSEDGIKSDISHYQGPFSIPLGTERIDGYIQTDRGMALTDHGYYFRVLPREETPDPPVDPDPPTDPDAPAPPDDPTGPDNPAGEGGVVQGGGPADSSAKPLVAGAAQATPLASTGDPVNQGPLSALAIGALLLLIAASVGRKGAHASRLARPCGPQDGRTTTKRRQP